MGTTRTRLVFGLLLAVAVPLLGAASVEAQPWVYYPNAASWGASSGPYYPSYPGPLYPPRTSTSTSIVRTSASASPAYGAAASDGDARPSYYSEDYSGPEGPTEAPSKIAYIRVRVPARPQLWINGEKRTQQAGAIREFVTPALDPDFVYVYNVKVRWTEEGGINVEKTLRVRTISGTRVTVNFVPPPTERPREVVQAQPTPPRALQVEQQPVDWTFSSAPRSFNAPRP